ncbi:DegV family protein [Liquorilactobacillus sucicola DSM 21376 = JCM 15457]|uniref:DegV family protein n=1 Tax=Liquorilactobacillus sucicola DSM 21376 = JCM 15457 TaxID=1423806 RepID=A0A023CUJ0_9LACO|nr:DegV family protein [Liquorilactobacillus sucicola]KRN05491.1 DegV family protein [Liquorilactobacillus sucicola DSM 21376 = JCM 15457]GAJ25573.1 DegV family protein [Liquorilactobacillus sucicola DSM 21376 = JCM 15457]
MKIAVVTDSTAYLTDKQINDYNIHVVPIPVIIDNKVYKEGIDISTEDFYQKLKTADSFPSTSQPPVGELISLYESLGNQGYDAVISIHLASTISGFVQTLTNIAGEVHNIKVVPFDSQITVMLMGNMVIAAARMALAGASVDEILMRLRELRATTNEYFIVDDLQNLVRGGRLSNASAFIGSVLKIKPLLTFDRENHRIVAFDKVRSRKKAIKRVENLFDKERQKIDYPLRLIIIHANDEEAAAAWKDQLVLRYPNYPIDISYFGPVIGTHLGEKALALAWMKDIDKE